jgi:NAD(P)-dependent dehydrogenase (short-subunit alcohol dehydrogenase family)
MTRTRQNPPPPLHGRIAVVTGASRGAGKGIALELGAAGATVYVTGRSVRGERNPHYDRFLEPLGLNSPPGTIDDTADAVTALGGQGIPVRCDHTDERDVVRLFERVAANHGRLDLLVNNAWGGHEVPHEWGKPFWELSPGYWDAMFTGGVRNHWLASRHAVALMLSRGRGLIVTVSYWDEGRYIGNVFYDLAKAAMNRLAFGMAQELRPRGIASVVVVPGWMRTEFVLAAANATEDTWQAVEGLASTESPRYVGRAIAELAGDADVLARSGEVLYVADLAREYGFTDIDGRQVPRFEPAN